MAGWSAPRSGEKMTIDLRWLVSTPASSLHAAAAMIGGAALVDRKSHAAIESETNLLRQDLVNAAIPPERFFEHAIPASTQFDSPARLVEVVLTKILGPSDASGSVGALARRLVALQAAFDESNPAALDELELRSGPFRDQWEARGPGLMATLSRLTAPELLVESADAILVQPVLGGGGVAHPLYNSVRIEAVLANPMAELPEIARLGWLLSQLKLDLPKYQENLPPGRLLTIGPLAMIAPALAAAAEVELGRLDVSTLSTAVRAWSGASADSAILMQWWETYQTDRPDWTVALGALSRMLGPEPPEAQVDRIS
jgi:hypothetical protein